MCVLMLRSAATGSPTIQLDVGTVVLTGSTPAFWTAYLLLTNQNIERVHHATHFSRFLPEQGLCGAEYYVMFLFWCVRAIFRLQ